MNGDLQQAVQQLKREPGKGPFVGGVTLPQALAEMGLIDEYELHCPPPAGRPRADIVRGALAACRLEARQPSGVRLGCGGDAV